MSAADAFQQLAKKDNITITDVKYFKEPYVPTIGNISSIIESTRDKTRGKCNLCVKSGTHQTRQSTRDKTRGKCNLCVKSGTHQTRQSTRDKTRGKCNLCVQSGTHQTRQSVHVYMPLFLVFTYVCLFSTYASFYFAVYVFLGESEALIDFARIKQSMLKEYEREYVILAVQERHYNEEELGRLIFKREYI